MADSEKVRVYSKDGSGEVLSEFDPGFTSTQPMAGMIFTSTALVYQPAAHAVITEDENYTLLTYDAKTYFRCITDAKDMLHTSCRCHLCVVRVHKPTPSGDVHRVAAVDTKKVVNYDCTLNQYRHCPMLSVLTVWARHARFVAAANFTDCKMCADPYQLS